MIFALVAVLAAGLVVGALILGDSGRRSGDSEPSNAPGWVSLVCGALGVLAVVTPMVDSWLAEDGVDRVGKVAPWLFPASMTLGAVGLATGIYALVRRDRTWRLWAGLATSGLVMAFWLLFVVGELVYPH
ncbi:MAG: hypothetical protein WCF12_03520 [Propionicimonas sp.]